MSWDRYYEVGGYFTREDLDSVTVDDPSVLLRVDGKYDVVTISEPRTADGRLQRLAEGVTREQAYDIKANWRPYQEVMRPRRTFTKGSK